MSAQTQLNVPESRDFIKTNVGLFIWLIFLALGGGLLALYYSRIGYLPDIDWHSLLIYIAVASIIGASIGVLQFLLVFLPGYIWAEVLVADKSLVKVLCPPRDAYDGSKDNEPCVFEIFKRLGLPFAIVFFLAHIFLPLNMPILGVNIYFWVTPLLLISSSIYVSRNLESQVREPNGRRSRMAKYGFWFAVSVILSQTALFLIYQLASNPKRWDYIILTLICTTGVLVSNHAVALRYTRHPMQGVMASVVAAFLLLFAADRYTSLSAKLMALYGIGDKCKVSILLNEEGARFFGKLNLPPNSCDPLEPNRICDAEMLSRVGSEYFLSLKGKNFTLPKSMVISWAADDKRNNQPQPVDDAGKSTSTTISTLTTGE
jgi:hypothetical protein